MSIYTYFKNNKYTKWYINIISSAIARKLDIGYYEEHHILPKSCFPKYKKEKWNLVSLTAKEHFVCHMLLRKMMCTSNNTGKMITALFYMSNIKKYREMTSKMYETLRRDYASHKSTIMTGRIPYNKGVQAPVHVAKMLRTSFLGKHHTDESKQRKRLAMLKIYDEREAAGLSRGHMKGRVGVNGGKMPSLETRRKMSLAGKGKKRSVEHNRKVGLAQRGKICPTSRLPKSEEHKRKISEGHIAFNQYRREHPNEFPPRNNISCLHCKRAFNSGNLFRHFKAMTNTSKISESLLPKIPFGQQEFSDSEE